MPFKMEVFSQVRSKQMHLERNLKEGASNVCPKKKGKEGRETKAHA
jgi:hypothetical protein